MNENKSHWTVATDTAKNYSAGNSIAFAADHLEALLNTRLMVQPNNLNKSEWIEYKDTTAKLS